MPESASHAAHSEPKSRAGIVGPLALVVALVGAALAGLALYRSGGETRSAAPASAAQPAATDQQSGDPKMRTCEAFSTVRNAVSLQTHQDLGTEPVALQAVAANARLAMIGGAIYLQNRTDPAAPAELVTAITSFTDGLQAIGVNALAGITNEDATQAGRLRDAQVLSDRIVELCK
jgi:hypothetical protein